LFLKGIDQEAPLPSEEVTLVADQATLVERVTVSEHFMVAFEYVPLRPAERPPSRARGRRRSQA